MKKITDMEQANIEAEIAEMIWSGDDQNSFSEDDTQDLASRIFDMVMDKLSPTKEG